MKQFLIFLMALLQITTPAFGQAGAGGTVDGTNFPGIFHSRNYVKNPGAEKNFLNTTRSASIVTRNTSSPLLGSASFGIDGTSSGQTVKFDTASLDNVLNGKNCEARFDYSGDGLLYKAYVEQGSSRITSEMTLSNISSGAQTASINFPCGDLSSNSHLVIETTSASAAAIKVDNVYLGAATNLSNVAQAKQAIRLYWTGSLAANHNTDTDLTFASASFEKLENFTHSSGVFTVTVAGDYKFRCGAREAYVADAAVSRQRMVKIYKNSTSVPTIVEGYTPGNANNDTNGGGEPGSNVNSNPPTSASASLSLAVGDTVRCKFYQANGNGTNRAIDSAWVFAEYFPTATQQAISFDRNTAWWAQAVYSGANPALSKTDTGGHVEITNGSLTLTPVSGSQPVGTLCSSTNAAATPSTSATTCSAGNESIGLTFNIPEAGAYTVCVDMPVYHDQTAGSALAYSYLFKLAETGTATQTIAQDKAGTQITSRGASSTPGPIDTQQVSMCRVFSFTSVGQKAVRLFGYNPGTTSADSAIILSDSFGGRNITMTVMKGAYTTPMPVVLTAPAPTIQRFTSGSGTYTKPAGVKYIKVKMIGAGGGGGGSGTAGVVPGTVGGNTTFGTSLLTANGGGYGDRGSQAPRGAGGTATVNSPATTIAAVTGGYGGSACNMNAANLFVQGGMGGSGPFGGAGNGSYAEGAQNGSPNTGAGGGGAGSSSGSGTVCGGGGGSGGYIEAMITNPDATYAYAVGAGGSGGSAGTGGYSGGAGGSGVIIVEEYYQ